MLRILHHQHLLIANKVTDLFSEKIVVRKITASLINDLLFGDNVRQMSIFYLLTSSVM